MEEFTSEDRACISVGLYLLQTTHMTDLTIGTWYECCNGNGDKFHKWNFLFPMQQKCMVFIQNFTATHAIPGWYRTRHNHPAIEILSMGELASWDKFCSYTCITYDKQVLTLQSCTS